MKIVDFCCPVCGVKFMEVGNRGKVKRLPNHHQFPIVLSNGSITHLAVCKECFKGLKKKDHIEIFEAVKDYWKKEIGGDRKAIKRIDELSFKQLSTNIKYT